MSDKSIHELQNRIEELLVTQKALTAENERLDSIVGKLRHFANVTAESELQDLVADLAAERKFREEFERNMSWEVVKVGSVKKRNDSRFFDGWEGATKTLRDDYLNLKTKHLQNKSAADKPR